MPSIEHASRQMEGTDIVFLVASDEAIPQIRDFRSRFSFDLNFLQIRSGAEDVPGYALPTTLLFDSRGHLTNTEQGARAWDEPEEIQKLKALIKAQ